MPGTQASVEFKSLLILELGREDVSAKIHFACRGDRVQVEAESLDGSRRAGRHVLGVYQEADPERVLALAASELLELRWNRMTVKNEPETGESDTSQSTLGPTLDARLSADLLQVEAGVMVETEVTSELWVGALTNGTLAQSDKVLRASFDADGKLGSFEVISDPLPTARSHVHQTPVYDGRIYSVGGRVGTSFTSTDQVVVGQLQ